MEPNDVVLQLLPIAIVCDRTALSRSAIYRLIASGRLKPVKIGKSVRVSESELRRFFTTLETGKD
jgi:excisionase family DNA binding protein